MNHAEAGYVFALEVDLAEALQIGRVAETLQIGLMAETLDVENVSAELAEADLAEAILVTTQETA
jgi:hypothetical protein